MKNIKGFCISLLITCVWKIGEGEKRNVWLFKLTDMNELNEKVAVTMKLQNELISFLAAVRIRVTAHQKWVVKSTINLTIFIKWLKFNFIHAAGLIKC